MKSKSGITWFKASRYLSGSMRSLQSRLTELQDRLKGIKTETNAPSPLVARCARYRAGFLSRIVPWEKIDDDASWDKFPYYIDERDKNLLVECVSAHLKPKPQARECGSSLKSSCGRILLQSMPGTEVYRYRMVRTLARQLQVPLLELRTHDLPPFERTEDIPEDKDDYHHCYSSDSSDDEDEDDEVDDEDEDDVISRKAAHRRLREGDRVKYDGPRKSIKVDKNRTLSYPQRGEARKVRGDKVGVIFYTSGEKDSEPPLHWLDAKYVKRDSDVLTHDCYIALEVLCDVLESHKSIIVYFPDPFCWLSSKSSYWAREQFFVKVKEMFDQLSTHKVLICGQNKSVEGSKDMEKKLAESNTGITKTMGNKEDEMKELFTNVVYIAPPKDEALFEPFHSQIIKDSETILCGKNISEMHKVLKEHDIMSDGLELVDTKGLMLKTREVEKIVGWAKNHYLSSSQHHSVKDGRLNVPTESFELAISRFKEKRDEDLKLSGKKSSTDSSDSSKKSLEDLAKGEYEMSFVSAVVSPGDIGVKFDDVGALDDVKSVLEELVIQPIKRPQLFSSGNLLKPCKGLLLFGPPGTGKTLIAKAIATEAGANFITVDHGSISSMWYGEGTKFRKALFSFARKLTPVIIFIDEVDALLGARGAREHEATRRMKNEFMASWDGITSSDNERILVIGATNRPFDLDDAVIRRMPRRIYVDLPDANNRLKILKIILSKENLEPGFSFERLARDTDGYSGSDLKNLCVAAAYRPVHEFLEKEKKDEIRDEAAAPTLRALKLDDFIRSKAKVGKSVAQDSTSLIELMKWNEQYGEGGSRRQSPFAF